MGVADGGADIFVAEELLDFPQILSHVVKEDRRRGVTQAVGCDLPQPEGSTGRPEPQIERTVGDGAKLFRGYPEAQPARSLPEKFLVAFSLAGKQRDLVRAIAEAVEQELGSGTVFFDEWFSTTLQVLVRT